MDFDEKEKKEKKKKTFLIHKRTKNDRNELI
jgi:hypothetical protein